MTQLTPWQRIAAETYAAGDFSHVERLEDCRDIGDTLFTFVMIELDPKEGCESQAEAIRRIDNAIAELEDVRDTLMGLKKAKS